MYVCMYVYEKRLTKYHFLIYSFFSISSVKIINKFQFSSKRKQQKKKNKFPPKAKILQHTQKKGF